MFTPRWGTAERKYDIVGSMRPETAADCCLLQEGEIKKRSITMRAPLGKTLHSSKRKYFW